MKPPAIKVAHLRPHTRPARAGQRREAGPASALRRSVEGYAATLLRRVAAEEKGR
jgi:hypothetical protein